MQLRASRLDIARQIANLIGSILQISLGYLGIALGLDIAAVAEENRSTIDVSGYAFVIWLPIFLLTIAYAVYQVLPSRRTDPLLRRIGWFTAGAFLATATWQVVFPNRQVLLAAVVIFLIWVCLAFAFTRMVGALRTGATTSERWLVALPIGLMFGWLTAANVVALAGTLISFGFAAQGPGATVGGAALLLFGGAVAGTVVAWARSGPVQAWAAYLGAVIWALVGIAVEQAQETPLTAATAVVVAVALIGVAAFSRPTSGMLVTQAGHPTRLRSA